MVHQLITKRDFQVQGIRKKTLSAEIRVGSFSLMVIMIGLICVLGLLFLQQFNNVATKGYELRRLENERMQLIKANEIQDMKIAQARTLQTILDSEVTKKMIKIQPEKIVYIRTDTTGLAAK